MIKKEGVVVDRFDPEGHGRVRVRVKGLHSEFKLNSDFQGFSTQELPWYDVVLPPTSGNISGVGRSPRGIIEGATVEVTFSDEDFYDGRVTGVLSAAKRQLASLTANSGFNDPSGLYPQYQNESDTNILSGFNPGKTPASVQDRDQNLGLAIRPDGTIATEENRDDNPNYSLQALLHREEGYKNRVYFDSKGYPTVGIGHLIVHEVTKNAEYINKLLSEQIGREIETTGALGSITDDEITMLFDDDVKRTLDGMARYPKIQAAWESAGDNNPRKWVLISMAFQMGVAGLNEFTNSLSLMAQGKWAEARLNMLNSKWAREDSPGRANRHALVIASGNMLAYGVAIPEHGRTTMMALFAAATNENSPAEPAPKNNSPIMFEEPVSDWRAEYPYNDVVQTESGHIIEIDDTPGRERMHWRSASGIFEEWRAGGGRVSKVPSTDFRFVGGADNLQVSADQNMNVMGNQQHYIVGNSIITIASDGTLNIYGNNAINIQGNQDVFIKGNQNVSVEGNVTINVKGTTTVNATGDVELNAEASVRADIASDFIVKTGGNIDMRAGGNVVLDGSRIDVGL